MSVQAFNYVDYGLSQALTTVFPAPLVVNRAPTTADKAQIGRTWVYPATNSAWILTSIVNNSATWESTSGGTGSFSSLTVTPGPISLTGTTNINTTGAAVTTIGNTSGASGIALNVGTGNFALDGAAGSTITVGSSLTTGTISIGGTAQTGTITLGNSSAAQTVDIGFGNTGVKNINIGTGTVANVVSIGSTTGAAQTTISAGTQGISLAAPFTALPGPVYIYTGSGAPSNGLALHAGDLYINTSAASATTRLYIATGAGAWTFFAADA